MTYLDYPGIILREQAVLAIGSFSPRLSNLSLHFCYSPWEIESIFDFVVIKISKKHNGGSLIPKSTKELAIPFYYFNFAGEKHGGAQLCFFLRFSK